MKLQFDISKLYAVALEGGGAKGAYQIGAWRALREAGVKIGAVSGTSVGALNGALMVMGDLEKAEKIWREISYSKVMDVDDEDMKNLLSLDLREIDWKSQYEFLKKTLQNRGLDITPLRTWMEELVDEDAIRTADTELYIQTYSLSDRKELELRAKDLEEPGEITEMLLASAYFPAFRNELLGGKRYTDGGLQDVIPLHALVSRGCRDIIAIRLFGPGLEKSFKIPRYVNIHTILPGHDLGGTLEFEAEQSIKNMEAGYFDAKRMLYGLAGEKYYVDRMWSEEDAYAFLVRYLRAYLHDCGTEASLREINEKYLPRLRKSLECKGDYYDLFLRAAELAAEEAELDPFAIRTEEELLAALEPRFGFASALYPACLTKALSFRSVFIHSKKLWNRRKEP
ncbi:MAG: patatin-like phospholipase family protein [Oscillospiraceae bacterium]|nr:patatin-like phospholipase family protein [Oscillospiraceae bacterium]